MCSIVSGTVSTFAAKPVHLANYTKPNCSVLMVADCSPMSRYGLFVTPLLQSNNDANSSDIYLLELHVDDQVIWYSPRKDGTDFIRLKNMTEIEISSIVRPFGDITDLR